MPINEDNLYTRNELLIKALASNQYQLAQEVEKLEKIQRRKRFIGVCGILYLGYKYLCKKADEKKAEKPAEEKTEE